jgi:hypothetical protein
LRGAGVISVNCLSVETRARGMGAQIFVQHILGDVISPPIVGAISDSSGSLLAALEVRRRSSEANRANLG